MIAALPDPQDAALASRARTHAALGDATRLAIVESLLLTDLAPDELAAALGLGTNLLAHHLAVLEEAGLVVRTASEGDRRRRYLRQAPGPVSELLVAPRLRARSVLFVCTANSARSQLAAALWRTRSAIPAASAGQRPADAVAPGAARLAAEHDLGLDAPRGYDAIGAAPGLVVSVCDRAREASFPFTAPRLHWSVPDPVGKDASAMDAAYAELEGRIRLLANHVDAA